MALQGTLETFSVPEVLRLLSGTRKTGLLALEGDRGAGNVWLLDGRIVGARSDHEQGEKIEAVLFDLLRFGDGSFVFETDSEPEDDDLQDADVEEALVEAERLLEEWREIESVVPSLDITVRLVEELSDESVTVTAEQWRSLAALGGGTSVRRLGVHHDMGEFDVSRLVRDLVEAGLVEVDLEARPEPADAPDRSETADEAYPSPTWYDDDRPLVDNDLSHDEVAHLGQNLAGFVARGSDDDAGETDDHDVDDQDADDQATDRAEFGAEWTDDADDTVHTDTDDAGTDDAGTDDAGTDDAGDTDDAAATAASDEPEASPGEFLSQLASLTPKTAAAAPADEAPVEAPVESDGDEEINRNLLLKFLSSAKN